MSTYAGGGVGSQINKSNTNLGGNNYLYTTT
jgi:hypothetical protein